MKELAILNDLLLFQKPWLNEMKQKFFLQTMVDMHEHIRVQHTVLKKADRLI